VLGILLLGAAILGGLLGKVTLGWWVFALFQVPAKVRRHRIRHSRFVDAVTGALVRIAERHPAPELGGVVRDLEMLSADAVRYTPDSRVSSRRAAERIKALVHDLRTMPVASSPPPLSEVDLPRPARSPEPDVEVLPRVRG
jgi:hypothetical protein